MESELISTVKPAKASQAKNDASDNLPTYRLADSQLGMGASFGNSAIWINTKNTGAIERVFSVDHGQSAIGAITTHDAIAGTSLDGQRTDIERSSYMSLRPDGPLRTFELHPAFQRCTFTIANSIEVSETTFVPLTDGPDTDDPPVAFQVVELKNCHPHERRVRFLAFARLRGSFGQDTVITYDHALNAFAAFNRSDPATTRCFGFDRSPTSYATTYDFAAAYDPARAICLDDAISAQGDVLGVLQLDLSLKPRSSERFAIIAAAYAREIDDARRAYRGIPDSMEALQTTVEHLQSALARSRLLTPDALLNDGCLWSKVNMRRVMARYPQGSGFTNDPGNTPNIVVRDCAWFVYGCDHFMPEFSRLLLNKLVAVQYTNGKMPEYFDGITGRIEDDGLNINDDTPLFILAANHHFRATGDQEWLETTYAAIAKAADYIISQQDERGLVFCEARDPRGNVWGIAGWRNIIPGYLINGATTEINAECAAALRAAGHLAAEAGHEADSRRFSTCWAELRDAMDRHLKNPANGLYYLNIDVDGKTYSDVTGDQIFPVMFRACDEQTAFRIISRLNAPDFATPAGLRTASRNDPRYDPAAYAGLLGGVWPGLTWWYSFAAARYHPDGMVSSLRSSFAHYASDPRKNNTVPGQFSEWFDGESLANKGMRLSPWEPPRFLWASIEGVSGLMLTTGAPRITPLIPASWRWVGVCNLPYHGGYLTYFVTRQGEMLHLYSTTDVDWDAAKDVFEEDVSPQVSAFSEAAAVIALRRGFELMVLVGNAQEQTVSIPLDLRSLLGEHAYRVRMYNSEHAAWEERERAQATQIASLAISIESQGFRLLHLVPA